MPKTILVDAWKTFVTEDGVFQEMQKMLDGFDVKKLIVTNANAEERESFGMVDMPYPVFSLDHSPNKTDSSYFEVLLKEHALDSSGVLYFEHNKEAVDSAISVGIASYWYDHEKKDLKALEDWIQGHL